MSSTRIELHRQYMPASARVRFEQLTHWAAFYPLQPELAMTSARIELHRQYITVSARERHEEYTHFAASTVYHRFSQEAQ